MPIRMDRHDISGARVEDVVGAHQKDFEIPAGKSGETEPPLRFH